jgi:hypothetical protein
LPYAKYQAEPEECHPGTREAVITEIVQWFVQPLEDTAERLFWLYGVAGCGKSTIAQTIARQLSDQKRCVSFFFDATRQVDKAVNHLFSTISRDLADLNDGWKASLIRTIKGSAKASNSSTVKAQFENLMLKPAKDLEVIGPILIIIDALDESGSREQRSALLQMLARIKELPSHFRFLVTSRPEPDIVEILGDNAWVRPSRLDRLDQASIHHDIRSFVHHRLSQITVLKNIWNDKWVDEITSSSGQLFQWAFTACKYISGDGTVGCDSLERLQQIITSRNYNGLDSLYHTILERLCIFQPGDVTHRRFQVIIGRVLSVRQPLSLDALAALWSEEEDKNQVENILLPLGSLFRGVSGQHEPIQPLHVSFINFLTDKTRSGRFWIDLQYQDEMLSRASFRQMQNTLRFNICGLETSYVFDRDITDLQSRVQRSIPSHVSYACCFWIDHLRTLAQTEEWGNYLYAFMQRYLLFWIEVLGLLNKVDRALVQLSILKNWLEGMVSANSLNFSAIVIITYTGDRTRTIMSS